MMTRGAAAHRSGKTWTLDWDGRRHAVALATKNDEETITVDVAKGDRSNTRTFVAFVHGWRPRGAAKEAYEAHTKRAHDGNAEELRLFFEVGAEELFQRFDFGPGDVVGEVQHQGAGLGRHLQRCTGVPG